MISTNTGATHVYFNSVALTIAAAIFIIAYKMSPIKF